MSITQYTDQQFFGFLENSSKMFTKLGLKLSAITVNEIVHTMQNQIPKIDRTKITALFHDLQDSIDVEFCKISTHHKNIFCLLQSDYRISLKIYPQVVNQVFNMNNKVDKLERRINIYRNLEILRSAVMRNNPSIEEKFVGLSYAYLGIVDGLYKLSLQECYVWHKIAKNEPIHMKNILDSSPAEIYNHFLQEKINLSYFDGWDRTVRNSVGHSSFKYDNVKQQMTYENYDRKTGNYNTIDYTYDQLGENYYKLEAIYHAVLAITHISMVNDSSRVLCDRYP
ncbi:hypothetical protein [Candidatus Nitrosotalea okcheonensis]|uniref:Uncharacterized protein n=1 Tax=Candidatus Nitrosotalea okcheonensis TaxID=1903276 RepID=A0A2H1FGY5_9ARCH|nr:hypothetical protein [Candidatus Nitrosotalea okcheonensis]SMH72021.1 protein of unknown function [Candidatus Nitrosotalea okcheonensis]